MILSVSHTTISIRARCADSLVDGKGKNRAAGTIPPIWSNSYKKYLP